MVYRNPFKIVTNQSKLAIASLILLAGSFVQGPCCQSCLAEQVDHASATGELVVVPADGDLDDSSRVVACASLQTTQEGSAGVVADNVIRVVSNPKTRDLQTAVVLLPKVEADRSTDSSSNTVGATEDATPLIVLETPGPAIALRSDQVEQTSTFVFDAFDPFGMQAITVNHVAGTTLGDQTQVHDESVELPGISSTIANGTGSLEDPVFAEGHASETLNSMVSLPMDIEPMDIEDQQPAPASAQDEIQYVAAMQESILNPTPIELPATTAEQVQPSAEIIEQGTSGSGWVMNSQEIDVNIINDLRADILPKALGGTESQESAGEKSYPLPENYAVKESGVFENAPYVGTGARRFNSGNLALWAAPKFRHKPLYFEQPKMERYGHHVGGPLFQSTVSAAHFFGTIPLLPYKMGVRPPCSCDYTLGRYRPGNCNPATVGLPEFSYRGLLYQGLFTTGASFVIP